MTPPQLLAKVRTGDFVGAYRPPEQSDSTVGALAVFRGEIPEGAQDAVDAGDDGVPEGVQDAVDASDVDVYKLRPISVIDGESTFDGSAFAVAAVQGDELALVVDGAVTPAETETDTKAPVFKGEKQFKRLFGDLVQDPDLDHLNMRLENTNLSPDEARSLGFTATSDPEVLRVELPDDHRLATAA